MIQNTKDEVLSTKLIDETRGCFVLCPSYFDLNRRQSLPVRGRWDSLLPAFGCDHLLENALFLLFAKSALGQGRFGLTNFALLMPLVKLADDTPQASRAVEN